MDAGGLERVEHVMGDRLISDVVGRGNEPRIIRRAHSVLDNHNTPKLHTQNNGGEPPALARTRNEKFIR